MSFASAYKYEPAVTQQSCSYFFSSLISQVVASWGVHGPGSRDAAQVVMETQRC